MFDIENNDIIKTTPEEHLNKAGVIRVKCGISEINENFPFPSLFVDDDIKVSSTPNCVDVFNQNYDNQTDEDDEDLCFRPIFDSFECFKEEHLDNSDEREAMSANEYIIGEDENYFVKAGNNDCSPHYLLEYGSGPLSGDMQAMTGRDTSEKNYPFEPDSGQLRITCVPDRGPLRDPCEPLVGPDQYVPDTEPLQDQCSSGTWAMQDQCSPGKCIMCIHINAILHTFDILV